MTEFPHLVWRLIEQPSIAASSSTDPPPAANEHRLHVSFLQEAPCWRVALWFMARLPSEDEPLGLMGLAPLGPMDRRTGIP